MDYEELGEFAVAAARVSANMLDRGSIDGRYRLRLGTGFDD